MVAQVNRSIMHPVYIVQGVSNAHCAIRSMVQRFICINDGVATDPCMGSGHILVYAFDVFLEIYRECGYSDRDAAINILQNNLYGLDIDGRSYQLAYFSVMMKARSYNRRILNEGIKLNIAELIEPEKLPSEEAMLQLGDYKEKTINLINKFKDAKELGSLIDLDDYIEDIHDIDKRLDDIDKMADYGNLLTQQNAYEVIDLMSPFVDLAKTLTRKYSVVTTNPPYLSKMESILKKYVTENYKDYSSDLFSVFMIRNMKMASDDGYVGFMTPFVWMFIKSYEKLREYILNNKSIATLVQMEYSAYKEATVPICSFVLKNKKDDSLGYYFRLSDFKGGMEVQKQKVLEAISNKDCGYFYEADSDNFSKIPGLPIAYWVSNNTMALYKNNEISDYVECKSGIMTGSEEYIRLWFEPSCKNVKYNCLTFTDMQDYKWFPLNSGGGFRKWYGNNSKLINLYNDGEDIRNNVKNYRLRDKKYYFKMGITWGRITSSDIAFRDVIKGSLFGDAGPVGFVDDDKNYILGFLNSKLVKYLLNIVNPTLNYQVHDIMGLPVVFDDKSIINKLVDENITLSKTDWDSFETSWDFEEHPLVRWSSGLWDVTCTEANMSYYYGYLPKVSCPMEITYLLWQGECNHRFNQLKSNEEELNRIFIDIYGLQDELTPEVEDKDVTVRKADKVRDIKSFISYAVGCMFGRYSLNTKGLVYAGGEWDSSKYLSFLPDKDDILPICDDEYFEDDIVGRFIEFVKEVYGEETLEENLKYISDTLGGKGTPREVIRSYFLNDFFKDHCNTYQVTGSGKRPIYWLFDSGKKNGFKALMYIHRYTPDLIARMRTDYIHPQQARYRTNIEMLQSRIDSTDSTSEKIKLNKEIKKLKEQEEELRVYEEKVHHWADKMEPMDLDDGVKVNYAKFQELLAKIK